MDVDAIQTKLIERCRFQVVSFIILGLIYARGAWNTFGVLFLAANGGHTCDIEKEKNTPLVKNVISGHETTLSYSNEVNTTLVPQACDYKVLSNSTNLTLPCTFGWVYKNEFWKAG